MTETATSNDAIGNEHYAPPGHVEHKGRWVRRAGYVAAGLALISASATFFILLGLTSIEPSQSVVVWALIINGILLLALAVAVGWEIARLWSARRRHVAGARLHIRIVALFVVVAVIPAILVAIVANITFAQGADHWFSSRTQQVVEASRSVAEQYIDLQLSSLLAVASALQGDFENPARRAQFEAADANFQSFLNQIPGLYYVPGVFLIRENGNVVALAESSASAGLPMPPPVLIAEAQANAPEPAIVPPTPVTTEEGETKAFAAAAVVLEGYNGILLYIVAEFDPQAVAYIEVAAANTLAYQELLSIRSGMQLVFGLIYFGVALMVLAAAVWMGLAVANRLVSPIGRLIKAADDVAGGDLSVDLPVNSSDGELATLSSSFNKMTHQLAEQRSELITASEQMDSRRRFIEAVLSGVTAGVIGVDADGKITVFNSSATGMLDKDSRKPIVGSDLKALLPELGPVLKAASKDRKLEHRDQITVLRDGRSRTINVRVTTERASGRATGYVITLDDITDLLTAQRTSVWADVARRIAHEIKNPLTPIQLSAERLRRKFGKVIEEDRAIFDQCTDTIIRQVSDIGRMVDEFSSFARMPKPTLELVDIRDTIRDTVFLMQVGNPDIEIEVSLPDERMTGKFDTRLVSQVVTNLIKNGVEAIEAVDGNEPGRVEVRGAVSDGCVVIDIIDNGIGFPRENRQMLLEPYMTTREKGTGLGLAIVRKIVEEHSGTIELLDAPQVADGGHGAMMRLSFPLATSGKEQPVKEAPSQKDEQLAPVAE